MSTELIRNTFSKEGSVVIPNFFSEEELSAIFPIISKAHEKWLELNRNQYLKNKMINSNNLTSVDLFSSDVPSKRKSLFSFISSDKMTSLVQGLIGEDAYFLGSQVFFNPKEHSKDGYWHRDMQYTGMSEDEQKKTMKEEPVVHFHIPFIDDHLFELIPGSHKKWDTEPEYEVRMNLNNKKNSDWLENAKNYDCKRGGIRIFPAHAIHRGKQYEKSPPRFVFDLLFAKKTEKSCKLY